MAGLYLGHQLGSNRWVFPFCALIMFAGLLVAYSTLNAEAKRVASTSTATHMSELSIMPLLRRRPMLVRMMALYALSQVAVGILAPTVPIYIDSQFGIKQKDLAGLIVVPAILIVLIALPLGSAADKIGRARAVWISYAMAAVGMIMVACTSFFAPTRQLFALPPIVFGAGILLLIMSYILGTPAWLGLTSLQVDDTRQAQALSLMQTSQGIGVVFAFAMVASAGHLMTQWNRVGAAIKHETVVASKSLDTVPLSVWFWVAALVFTLCLIGTLLWVRDTHHTPHEEELAQSAAQPLEITGIG
jgi:MFS family permease